MVVEIDNKKLTKRLDYDYDLVSGKVNYVYYQPNKTDQFIHRYEYDSDNRITKVFTSKDGVIWDNDAKYQYYAHGPLARTVTGELAVETQNFAYTIQGWIKGLNGQNFSYALGYNSTDYSSINNTNLPTPIATGKDLYNGNIATWTSNNKQLSTTNWTQQFEYDQLNRILNSKSIGLANPNGFKTSYTYNPNGSVQTLTRTNDAGTLYDDFRYHYHTTTEGYKENTNKLRWIDDSKGKVGDDLADQSNDNYAYDELGSMTAVNHKDIENIEWTLSGKMQRITYKPTSTLTSIKMIDYNYDPSGNKVSKTVTYRNGDYNATYFVHDATGNTMATYEASNTQALALEDQSIYGSSRLGVVNTSGRNYELTDHLGNVRTTLTEQGTIASANDYLPFGKLARSYQPDKYDFSFNGKLKDKETRWQDYGMRPYMDDEIIFPKVDPLAGSYPWYTPYQFAGNKPIIAVDLDGKEEFIIISGYLTDGTLAHAYIKVPSKSTIKNQFEEGKKAYSGYMIEESKQFNSLEDFSAFVAANENSYYTKVKNNKGTYYKPEDLPNYHKDVYDLYNNGEKNDGTSGDKNISRKTTQTATSAAQKKGIYARYTKISLNLPFEHNSSELSEEAKRMIDDKVQDLSLFSRTDFEIKGATSSSGEPQDNKKLSISCST